MAKIIDLRTYLLLERAFVRRLQRSWQQQSAQTYEAIAKACTDHEWDKARRLVTDLDMTEVGTENREWITYMLLSFAVFGASTVKKGKPSFVGVGSFDTFLKQVTNNFQQYLEHGATAQIQAEALQLIAEDEAKTKAVKFDYDQLRGPNGRWVKEPVSPDTPTSTAKTAIGLIHNGVVRVRDLNQRDPYEVGHEDYWRTEVPASSRFRYNKGNIEWLDKPNADEYFAVDDYFANKGWLIKGHYGQTYGDLIPPPAPTIAKKETFDESKHPRDKEGQFTDKLGLMQEYEQAKELGTDIEGGGPERAKWNKLNKAAFLADGEYFTERDRHRELVDQLTSKYEGQGKGLDIGEQGALGFNDADYAEYRASQAKLEAANEAKAKADEALKQQEPAMRIEVVTNLSTSVAKQLGLDPSLIEVVHKDPASFKVGGKKFEEGGHYSPSTGKIEINAATVQVEFPSSVKGMAAHEISHAMYHALKKAADAEFNRYLAKATQPSTDPLRVGVSEHTPWYHERFETNPTNAFEKRVKPQYREELAKEFPALAVMSHLAGGELFKGISTEMVKENGHSEYTKAYWTHEAVAQRGHTYDSAITETLADVTRFVTNPQSWYEMTKPSPDSSWVKLAKAMQQWYVGRQA